MNKFINSVLLFILLPTMALAVFIGFDLPIESLHISGKQFHYKNEMFIGIGLLILIINMRRSVRHWMGLRLVNQISKFKWNEPMSIERKKRVQVYTILEAVVLFFVGTVLYNICSEAWLPAIAFWFGAADNIVFLIVGSTKNRFRAGITSKAIIVADREVSLVYFTGLRKVSIQQETIYFDYIKSLQLSFPYDCVQKNQKDNFFEVLEKQLDTNRVFVTKNRS